MYIFCIISVLSVITYSYVVIIPAKARKYVFTGVGLSVCLSVCLSVTTITKKIITDLYHILLEGS